MKFFRAPGRFLAALLAAVLVVPAAMPQAASAGGFTDVHSGDWFYDAVDFVVGKGLFNGVSPTLFQPNGRMTRGMFAAVLGRYAKVDPDAWLTGTVTGADVNLRSGPGTDYPVVTCMALNTSVTIRGRSGDWYKVTVGSAEGYVRGDYLSPDHHGFTDVDYAQYYAGYTVWAFEKGIVTGSGSTEVFYPDSNITREQICTMLSRFAAVMGANLQQTGGTAVFPDDGSISGWARDNVYAMQRAGIVKGDAQGNFRPRGSATRAEAAAMLQRFDGACGGLNPPAQDPPARQPSVPATPAPTPVTPPEGGGTDVPPTTAPTVSPDPGALPDTPATLVGGTVATKAGVVRVGLLVRTNGFDNSVQSVTLQNTNGTGFQFGAMSDRSFVSGGVSTQDNTVTITTDGSSLTVADSAGNTVYTSSGELAVHPVSGGKALTCVNGKYKYYGDFLLRQAHDKAGYIALINYVGVEDYVKGVVPYEFPGSWPAETLKAAAVACRSYVMSYDWSIYSSKYGMDIIGDAGAQTYRGRGITYGESYFAATDAAVDATAGQYLVYDGKVCVSCYSSCDGGETLASSAVFGTNYAYLKGKTDPYEGAAADDIAAAGGNYGSMVKSSHRVGLSQWGAYAMAKYFGKDYQTILGFYYTGTNLQIGA